MTRFRGFTLMEAMVALAMAGVIIAGASSAVMAINRNVAEQGRRAAAWDEAKRLEEFLIARMQGAGGGEVRPFASVLVEDAQQAPAPNLTGQYPFQCRVIAGITDCATTGQDRVTVYVQDPSLPACTIVGTPGINIDVADDTPGHCCLDAPLGTAFEGKQALIISPSGQIAVVSLFNRHGPCLINAPRGQGSSLSPSALGAAAVPGSQLVVATATTLFVDADRRLMSWSDDDADAVVDAGELSVVHDSVHSLQFALGYDGNPEDGVVTNASSAADEWLFNAALDPLPTAGAWTNVRYDHLRMLNISIAVGARSGLGGGNTVQQLNGPAVTSPGVFLAATSSEAFLRNLNLFTQ